MEIPSPYKAEIVDVPSKGRIVVLLGYHKQERAWGQIIRDQFRQHITDRGNKIVFYELQDPRRADTGENSPYANAEVSRFLSKAGPVELVVDIHEQPGSKARTVHDSFSLTTDNQTVIEEAKAQVPSLRTLPFDDYSRSRTGGNNIPYSITDPDLPETGIAQYSVGVTTPEMRRAIDSSLHFFTSLANIHLEVLAASSNTSVEPLQPKFSDLYSFDRLLIQQVELVDSLITDEVFEQMRQRCMQEGLPWISPDLYFPVFNIGMARLVATTPDFVAEQCRAAENPNDPIVAMSIARNLMTEYRSKLTALRRIIEAKGRSLELVDVNLQDLEAAQRVYEEFMKTSGVDRLESITNISKQRQVLLDIVRGARSSILPAVQKAAQPVMEAGNRVMDIAYDILGIQKTQGQLPTAPDQLSSPTER
jgi:hypothetical protein